MNKPLRPTAEIAADLLRGIESCNDMGRVSTDAGLIREAAAALALSDITAERDRLRRLVDKLKLEAQGHAMEARGANATIGEIYQVVTKSAGEPGNWHGAKPVRDAFAALEHENAELRAQLAGFSANEQAALQGLLAIARAAWTLLDSTEVAATTVDVQKIDWEALSAAMDMLDVLPDDHPGVTLGEPGRAEWALRRLISEKVGS